MADELVKSFFALGNVARPKVNARIRDLTSRSGITERELQILEYIHSKTEVTFTDIVRRMAEVEGKGRSKTRLSTTMSKLYRDELIAKRPKPGDQRQTLIGLAAKGKTLMQRLEKIRREAYRLVRASMDITDDQAKELARIFFEAAEKLKAMMASQ